jgi:hypothetical protein
MASTTSLFGNREKQRDQRSSERFYPDGRSSGRQRLDGVKGGGDPRSGSVAQIQILTERKTETAVDANVEWDLMKMSTIV